MRNLVEDFATSLRALRPHPISVLRLGMLASIATTLTPAIVALSKSGFGVEDLTLHAGQSEQHEVMLHSKSADVVITSNPFYIMEGRERHAVLSENFLLVLPPDYHGPKASLHDIMQRQPLIRFAATTNIGCRAEQHLRRLKLSVPRMIQADRSSMVTACVSKGLGFTILTPSLLIDGLVEQMPLEVRALPNAGLSRSITVVARADELGDLPARLAEIARDALVKQVGSQMGETGISALTLPQ